MDRIVEEYLRYSSAELNRKERELDDFYHHKGKPSALFSRRMKKLKK